MDQIGRYPKFKINRKLNNAEYENRLKPYKYYQGDPPNPIFEYLTTIKINSSFLELTDRCLSQRGTFTFIGLCFLGFGLGFTIGLMVVTIRIPILEVILIFMMPFAMCYGSAYILLKSEWFNFTHNPIRFDRRNRMVYAFLYNKEVVAAPWDEIFFCMGAGNHIGGAELDIRGHIMAEDGVTVKATFALGYRTHSKYELENYWNFINHYMEKGPEELVPNMALYLPIADRKETPGWSFNHYLDVFGYIGFPFVFIFWPCRLLAMATCKVPVWPDWVEEKCQVEPDDPFARDASLNPPIEPFTSLYSMQATKSEPARKVALLERQKIMDAAYIVFKDATVKRDIWTAKTIVAKKAQIVAFKKAKATVAKTIATKNGATTDTHLPATPQKLLTWHKVEIS